MTELWIYSALGAFPCISCLILLLRLKKKKAEFYYISLFATLVLMNACQMIGYLAALISTDISEYFASAYLISMYFFFAHLLMTSFFLCPLKFLHRRFAWIYIFPCILTALHIFGLMVEDFRLEGNVMLHNDGLLAPLFDVFILTSSIFSISLLAWSSSRKSIDATLKSKNILALLSFAPIILSFAYLIIRSMGPNPVPVVGVIPWVSIFMAVSFYYISRDQVFDLSAGLSNFLVRVTLCYKYLNMTTSKDEFRGFDNDIKWQLIKEELDKCGGQISKVVEKTGYHDSTIRNYVKKYNYDASCAGESHKSTDAENSHGSSNIGE